MIRGFTNKCRILVSVSIILCGAIAHAAPTFYNTGQGLGTANGQTDIHWVTSASQFGSTSSALTYLNPAYTGGGAFTASPASNWIGFASAPVGAETWFTYQFDLTGYIPNSALSVSLIWSSDNDSDIFLNNGSSLGFLPYGSGTVANPYSFQTFKSITLNVGNGLLAGLNTLQFRVKNGAAQGEQGNGPTALRVQFNSFAGEPTPEPFTMVLGAAGIGLALRRRAKKA